MPTPKFGAIRGYAAALAALLAAYAITSLTWPLLRPTPWALFFAAVMLAAWSGGLGPGLLALGLATVAGNYAFIEPYGSFSSTREGLVATATFVVVSLFISYLAGARRRGEAREREGRRWFAATLSSVGDAVIATDVEGRVTFMNVVAERLTGWTTRDADGRPLEEVFAIFKEGTRERSESPVRRALETGRIVGLANHTVLIAKDGTETPIEDSAAPIKDDEGAVRGVIMVFRDASEQRQVERAQEAVRLSEQRFRALVTATSDVVYRMSPDWSEMLPLDGRGLVASNDVPIRDWLEKNIPASEHDSIREATAAAVASKGTFELEHRVIRPDGSPGWTFSRAVPILNAAGGIVEWFGTASDTTRRRDAEEAQHESERQARQSLELLYDLVELCPFGMYIVDADFRIATMNRGSQDGAFSNVRPVIGRPFDEAMRILWPEPVAADIIAKFRHTLDSGEPYYSKDFFSPRADKAEVEGYEWELHRVTLPDGRPGVACYYFDSTQLRRAEAALRENDRRKDEFLAMLAHELRNPLAAISNAVTLTTRSGVQEHIEWAMDVIGRQMKHLTHLIDDLLDVSRISRGKIELRRDALDVTPILDSAAATVRPLVEERKHTLDVEMDRGRLWANVDPTRLEQVVVNLLNNAAKYSDNGGHIRLSARNEGDEVVISVKDRGHGIPAEKLPQMFELFAQGDRSLARSEGGLGIGLTVVKRLVELHGGSVSAMSEGPGKGSEFTVRLPGVVRPASSAPTKPLATGEGRKSARILVIDDSEDTARGLARLLRLLGHEVMVAHSGPEGIERAREHRPEFVLLDIGLPGMDGYEVASRLRREESCKDAVIIAVSGYGQEEDRRRSKEAGFDHHLLKPLDHDALVSLLSAASNGQG